MRTTPPIPPILFPTLRESSNSVPTFRDVSRRSCVVVVVHVVPETPMLVRTTHTTSNKHPTRTNHSKSIPWSFLRVPHIPFMHTPSDFPPFSRALYPVSALPSFCSLPTICSMRSIGGACVCLCACVWPHNEPPPRAGFFSSSRVISCWWFSNKMKQ